MEIERWRLGKANLLRMTACGSHWKTWTVLLALIGLPGTWPCSPLPRTCLQLTLQGHFQLQWTQGCTRRILYPHPQFNPLSFKYPVICVDVHIGLTFYITQSRHLEILKNFYFTKFISYVLGITYKRGQQVQIKPLALKVLWVHA